MGAGKIAKNILSDKNKQSAILGKIGAFATNLSEKIGASALSEATSGTNSEAGSGVEMGPVGIDTNPQTRGEWVSNKEAEDKKKKTTMMLMAAGAVVLILFMFKKKK
ncbi:MAG: hypothetical protein RLZZ577_1644 [Bacteroidota bacterium]|jgi:hypothetical protein